MSGENTDTGMREKTGKEEGRKALALKSDAITVVLWCKFLRTFSSPNSNLWEESSQFHLAAPRNFYHDEHSFALTNLCFVNTFVMRCLLALAYIAEQ